MFKTFIDSISDLDKIKTVMAPNCNVMHAHYGVHNQSYENTLTRYNSLEWMVKSEAMKNSKNASFIFINNWSKTLLSAYFSLFLLRFEFSNYSFENVMVSHPRINFKIYVA